MDLVEYAEDAFNKVVDEFKMLSSKLDIKDVNFVPISALKGDNVVDKSENMHWYKGSTLMYLLENIHIGSDENHIDCRFPVQYVIRPQQTEYHDFRGYAGRIVSGIYKPGDKVKVLPSGETAVIKTIELFGENIDEAYAPMSVTMTLDRDVDISRGDMIIRENNVPSIAQDIDVMICWMNSTKLQVGGKYAIRHTVKDARCIVKEIRYKVDINTLHRNEEDKDINMNDIARINIKTTVPLYFDAYRKNRHTGSIILIDEATSSQDKEAALDILDNWRAIHRYPLHIFKERLEREIDMEELRIKRDKIKMERDKLTKERLDNQPRPFRIGVEK
jgi:sulfate adenylyltransferase subunit 1